MTATWPDSTIDRQPVASTCCGHLVAGEFFAQPGLQQLAGCRVRQAVDEDDIVRATPTGGLAFVKRQQFFAADAVAFFDRLLQRPFTPFGMRHADHGSFGNRGGAGGNGFQ